MPLCYLVGMLLDRFCGEHSWKIIAWSDSVVWQAQHLFALFSACLRYPFADLKDMTSRISMLYHVGSKPSLLECYISSSNYDHWPYLFNA